MHTSLQVIIVILKHLYPTFSLTFKAPQEANKTIIKQNATNKIA